MTHNENFNLDELPEELKGDIIPEIDPAKLFDEKVFKVKWSRLAIISLCL